MPSRHLGWARAYGSQSQASGKYAGEQGLGKQFTSRRGSRFLFRFLLISCFISLTKWANPATKNDSVRSALAFKRPLFRESVSGE